MKPFFLSDIVDEWKPRSLILRGDSDGGPGGGGGGDFTGDSGMGDVGWSGDAGQAFADAFAAADTASAFNDAANSAAFSGDNTGSFQGDSNAAFQSAFDSGNAGVSFGDAGVGSGGFGTGTFAADTTGSNFSGDMGGGGGWGTPAFSDYGGGGGGYYGSNVYSGGDFGGSGTYGDFTGGSYYGGGFDTYSGAPYADMGATQGTLGTQNFGLDPYGPGYFDNTFNTYFGPSANYFNATFGGYPESGMFTYAAPTAAPPPASPDQGFNPAAAWSNLVQGLTLGGPNIQGLNPEAYRSFEEGQQGRAGMNLNYSDLYDEGPPPTPDDLANTPFTTANPNYDQSNTPFMEANSPAYARENQDTPFVTANQNYTQDTPFVTANPNYDLSNTPFMEAINPTRATVDFANPNQTVSPDVTVVSRSEFENAMRNQGIDPSTLPSVDLPHLQPHEASETAQIASPATEVTPETVSNVATPAATNAAEVAAEQTGAPHEAAQAAGKAAGEAVSRGADQPMTLHSATNAAFQAGADQPQATAVGKAASDAAIQARDSLQQAAVQPTIPGATSPATLPASQPPSAVIPAATPTALPAPGIPQTPAVLTALKAPETIPAASAAPVAGSTGFPSLSDLFSSQPQAAPSAPSSNVSDTISNLLDMLNPISRAEARGKGRNQGRGQARGSSRGVGPFGLATRGTFQGGAPQGLVVHHTSGSEKSAEDVARSLKSNANASSQFTILRDGSIVQMMPDNLRAGHAATAGTGRNSSSQMIGKVFDNSNTVGVEVVAKNEKEVTPQQRESIARLHAELAAKYGWDPMTSIYGHGEISHQKEADEGRTAAMVRSGQLALPNVGGQPSAIVQATPTTPTAVAGGVGRSGGKEGTGIFGGPRSSDNPEFTFYAPGAKGGPKGQMEGGFETRFADKEGNFTPHTLQDFLSGKSAYVTGASDRSRNGETITLPTVTFLGRDGQKHTVNNVPVYIHDIGGAFRGQPGKVDIAMFDARGLTDKQAGLITNKGVVEAPRGYNFSAPPTAVAALPPAAPIIAPPTQAMPTAPYAGSFAGPDVIGERGQVTFADPLAGLPSTPSAPPAAGPGEWGAPATAGVQGLPGAPSGAAVQGPGLVPGWTGLSVAPAARSGEFPASQSFAPVGYPVTSVERGALPDIPPALQGYPVTSVERGSLPDVVPTSEWNPAEQTQGVTRGVFADVGTPMWSPGEQTQGLAGSGTFTNPGAVAAQALQEVGAPAGVQQSVSTAVEVAQDHNLTIAETAQVAYQAAKDAGAAEAQAQTAAQVAAEIAAEHGAPETTEARDAQEVFSELKGDLPVTPFGSRFGEWSTPTSTFGPDEAGMTTTGKGNFQGVAFDSRYGDWAAPPAGPYAGPFAGPDVVGGRNAPAETAMPGQRGIGSDWAASRGVDPGLAPSLQAINTVSPNYKGVMDPIINNVPEAQRSDFGKAINNLSDNAKANLLSRGPGALVDMISKSTGRAASQITGWINNQYATLGYPGYPGGMQGLGRDMATARDASIAQGTPGRASTQFQDPSIVADVRDLGSPGWVGQPQVANVPPASPDIALPSQDMPVAPETLPPMEPLSSPMPHYTGPGGIFESPETTPFAPPSGTPTTAAPPTAPDVTPQQEQQIMQDHPAEVAEIAQMYGVDGNSAVRILLSLMLTVGNAGFPQMAEGGRVDADQRQYYVPQGSRGDDFGKWPKAPTPDYPGKVAGYGREVARREYARRDAQRRELYESMARASEEGQIRINPLAWDYFLHTAPQSTHIEDRRTHDPTRDETLGAGYERGGSIPEADGWR